MKRTSRRVALWATAAVVAVLVCVLLVLAPGAPPSENAGGPSLADEKTKLPEKPGAVVAESPKRPDDREARSEEIDPSKEKDFQALAEAAMRIPDAARRQTVLTEILTEWLQADAAGFGKYLMLLEVEDDDAKLTILASVLSNALAMLPADVASSEAVREPVRRLILHLARSDPDAALKWADAWLEGDSRESTLVNISRALAQRSPAEGLQLAARIASPLRRMQAFALVGGVWARSDATAAASWASQLAAPTERAMALNAVLTSIAQHDPESAAVRLTTAERAMADEHRERYRSDLAAMNLTEADLANDPETYREMLEAGAVSPPTSSDVELMAEAARVVASKLASERGTAGVDWAQSLENEFLRLHGIKGAVAGWSRTEPESAASFVAANYARYPDVLTTVYDVWAESAPAQAAAGTRLLEDPALRAAATEAVASAWAVTDAVQAADWVDRLPGTERTDAVRLAVVSGLSAVNPVEAWNRAQAIHDPSLQYRGLKAAFSVIVIREPEVARGLLASANLAGRAAERLQEILSGAEQG